MEQSLLELIMLSLWCYGWHHLFSPGEALYFLSFWAYEHYDNAKNNRDREKQKNTEWYQDQAAITNDKDRHALVDLYNEKNEHADVTFERQIYLLKPMFLCSICFASIYGTGGYLLLHYTTWGIFPVSIISLIAVNKLTQRFYQ